MSNNNISNSEIVAEIASIPLAGVSTIACIIALGVLLYYKMWRSFIYRLVLYKFISLIVFSLSSIILFAFYLIIFTKEKAGVNLVNETTNLRIILFTCANGSLSIFYSFMTCLTVCVYLMALHNYQFAYKSDLCIVVPSILYFVIPAVARTVIIPPPLFHINYLCISVIVYVLYGLPILVNIVFTALTLVPLCCRACGYNLCMKTAATIESHRKALREILPFYSLLVPLLIIFIYIFNVRSVGVIIYSDIVFGAPGLIYALSFALHLFFIRKNLKKFRGKRKAPRTTGYGSVQRRTYHVESFTSEGISETCNTEHVVVSEDEEDTRFLLRKNNNV